MGRASKEEKQASNDKIIHVAARLFREQGVEATGVAEVMAAAGLTHGGFYRHFKSKDDLACAAIRNAFETLGGAMAQDIAQHGAGPVLHSYVAHYLSEQHVNDPGAGCPIAALGAEAGRGNAAFGREIDNGAKRMTDLFAQGINGDPDTARAKAIGLLTTLVGTIVLARSTSSASGSLEILEAGRQAAKQQIES